MSDEHDHEPISCEQIVTSTEYPENSKLAFHNSRNTRIELSSSDEESDFNFENFLSQSRPKSPVIKSSPTVIIVDDSDTDDEAFSPVNEITPKKQIELKSNISNEITKLETSSRFENQSVDELTQQFNTIDLTENNDSEVISDEELLLTPSARHLFQTPQHLHNSNDPITPDPITTPKSRNHNKDKKFISTREVLAKKLYFFFNETVFDSLLPNDMKIQWNKNLTKTAGYCEYRFRDDHSNRTVSISLSTKIITDEHRLKSTLIHEMCHAATWVINCVREGHGLIWRGWAEKAGRLMPDLPPITRCHSYSVETKFKYKCVSCYYTVGRHSKSIDTSRQCCPLCRSRIELVPLTNKNGTPRKLNVFAEFVKDNYNSVEKKMTHSEKMKFLSAKYNESKL